MTDNGDILEQLERLLRIYERSREMELKKAEISAKIASDILAQNRKATLDLMLQFSQFTNKPDTDPKPKE